MLRFFGKYEFGRTGIELSGIGYENVLKPYIFRLKPYNQSIILQSIVVINSTLSGRKG